MIKKPPHCSRRIQPSPRKHNCVMPSHCSPKTFINTVKLVKDRMTNMHHAIFERTPFYPYLDMSDQSITCGRVQSIALRYDSKKNAFFVGENILIPFSSSEFSLVVGLSDVGLLVDSFVDDIESALLNRIFPGRRADEIDQNMIIEKILVYVRRTSTQDMEDFVRLVILLLFSCLFFGKSKFVIPYLDDLNSLGSYAWGRAAHDYLIKQLKRYDQCGKKLAYLDGCNIGMMAWFYEHIPSLGRKKKVDVVPRLFKWTLKKGLPGKEKEYGDLISGLTIHQIMPIIPFPSEHRFIMATQPIIQRSFGNLKEENQRLAREISVLQRRNLYLESRLILATNKTSNDGQSSEEEPLPSLDRILFQPYDDAISEEPSGTEVVPFEKDETITLSTEMMRKKQKNN